MSKSSNRLNWEKANRKKHTDISKRDEGTLLTEARLAAVAANNQLQRQDDIELIQQVLALLSPEWPGAVETYTNILTWLKDEPTRLLHTDFRLRAEGLKSRILTKQALIKAGKWDPTKRSNKPEGIRVRKYLSRDAIRRGIYKSNVKEEASRVEASSPWLHNPALLPKKPPGK